MQYILTEEEYNNKRPSDKDCRNYNLKKELKQIKTNGVSNAISNI